MLHINSQICHYRNIHKHVTLNPYPANVENMVSS